MTDLVYDIEEVKDYAKRILMKLEEDEVYILLLNTRKKYCPVELSKSEEVIGRELIRYNDLDKITRKIRKVTRVEGIYADSHTLEDIPMHCFALYCLIDPRSTLKGYGEFISNINKWIYESFKGESNLELYRRIDSKFFSAIHRSRSRSLYRVIDIDKKDDNILGRVASLLEGNIRHVMETHGGYHITVDKNNETGRIIYEKINGHIENIEILDEPMNPIPGTIQGGFKVKGIMRDLWVL